MNAQRIQTTVTYEQWKMAKQNNWKWSELIKAGIGAVLKPDALQERLQAAEAEIAALKKSRIRRPNAPPENRSSRLKEMMGWTN